MITVERSTSIAASPEHIWSLLADFAHISAWAPNVDHSCLMSEQTTGVGMVRRIQTDGSTVVETVEQWEPNVTLRYRITGLPPVIKSLTNTWSLAGAATAATSRTTVTITTEIDAGARPPQQLIAKGVGRRLGSASELMLGGLAAWVDALQKPGAA